MAYTFEENNTWGSVDDGFKGLTDFHQKRKTLGFTQSKKLASLLGGVTVYVRSGTSQWPYNYVCLVEVVSGFIWVWIETIPLLFAFLKHIQAHERTETASVYISNFEELTDSPDVSNYLPGTYFAEAMKELYDYFKKKNSEQGGK